MASCVSKKSKTLAVFSPSEKMTHATEDGGASCSSTCSSCSSASLERRVNLEADKDRILEKVRVLQRDTEGLKSELSGGRVDADTVKTALEGMLKDHSVLCGWVSAAANALEVLNRETGGHAASAIANSQASLGEELRVLAERLSELQEVLCSGRGLFWPSRLRPSPTGDSCSSTKTNNDRGLPVVQSISSQVKTDENDTSPRLPDIYLTPSRPVYSSTSPQSSSHTLESIPHSSPPSSLPNLDPFTPDTISAPPTCDHSGVHSGVSTTITPVSRPTKNKAVSPRTLLGGDCGRGSSSTTVLQWLMSSTHQTAEEEEEEEEDGAKEEEGEGIGGSEWRKQREELSPAESETVETGTAAVASSCSTLSPPMSSPCADSGISSSVHSSHVPPSSLPPHPSRHYAHLSPPPPPLSVTMSDIEAMRAELAKLREEIRNTSNWSPSLCTEYSAPPPTSLSLPPRTASYIGQRAREPVKTVAHPNEPANISFSGSLRPGLNSVSGSRERFSTSSLTESMLESTPSVPRPFHHLSRSHSRVPRTPQQTSFSSHRRLFSAPHSPVPLRDQGTTSRPQLVDHSVQTMPVPANIHSSTKSWHRTEPAFHSKSPFTAPAPHTLPPNFTPHFVVHTSHLPSHTPSLLPFIP